MKLNLKNIIVCHLDRSAAERKDLSEKNPVIAREVRPQQSLGLRDNSEEISPRQNYYSKRSRFGCGIEMTIKAVCHLDRSAAERRDPLRTYLLFGRFLTATIIVKQENDLVADSK